MASKDLTFRLFGEDVNASLALRNISAESDKSARAISKSFGALPMVTTAAFTLAAGASVKMAADFQTATTQLITGAGESEANIGLVKDGLLAMAPAVGIGPTALANAMFLVESAGYRGAAGLDVMKAAAEGAKVGGADATVVANALTTVLTDYALPASQAADVTSKLVATVASGKTNMADLAGAMSTIAPKASAAGISMSEMLGAMGTMTGEGISAQQAAQDLSGSIASLTNPTSVQTGAMAQMGLSSLDVAKNLGKDGLSGTFDELSQAIMRHMGPDGLALESSFNQSKLAASSAQEMLDKLPASLQELGKGFLNNTVTQAEWKKALQGQDVLTSNLGKQFATTAKEANGFSDKLKAGGGSASTFNGLMSDMTGGQTGLSTGLALTGSHMDTLKANVKDISGATAEADGSVKGWAETQKDFSVQMEEAGAKVEAMGVKIGTALLPGLTDAVKVGGQWADSLVANKPLLYGIIAAVGVFAGVMVIAFVAEKTFAAMGAISRIGLGLSTAAQWVYAGAVKAVGIAQYIMSGALYENIAAMIASKGETLALAGMYAGEFVAGAVKAVASTALTTGALVLHAAASVGSAIATGATSAAMGIATAAQWAWNLAMSDNPIGLIIVAVAALVAGLIWFFTQTDLGKDIFKNVMDFCSTAVGWLGDAIGKIPGVWGGVVSFFSDSVANVGGFFSTIGDGIASTFKTAFNFVADFWNSTIGSLGFTMPAWMGGGTFGVPKMPHLATGGVTSGPTIALIGDNPGGQEIVQPLAMYKADLARERAAGASTAATSASSSAGFHIENFITQAGQSPAEIASNLGWLGRWAT